MAKEKATVQTGVDGSEVYQSPQIQVKFDKPSGTIVRNGKTLQKYEPAVAKVVVQFDPVTKKSTLITQKLNADGSAKPLDSNDKAGEIGIAGKWSNIDTTNFPGLDKVLQDKNSRANKDIDKQIIDTFKEGYKAKYGEDPTPEQISEGIARFNENRFKAAAIASTANTGGKDDGTDRSDGTSGEGFLSGTTDGNLKNTQKLDQINTIAGKGGEESEDMRYPLGAKRTDQDYIRFGAIKYEKKEMDSSTEGSTFTGGGSRWGDDRKLEIIGGTVSLPIQSGITDSIGVGWNDDTMNPMQMMGAEVGEGFIKEGGEGLTNALNNITKDVQGNSEHVKDMIKNAMIGKAVGTNVMSRMTGGVMNPNLELLFQAPQLRAFTFNFRMTPRDKEEAREVKKIIRFFKKNMTPIRDSTALFLMAPNVFSIEYIHKGSEHPGLNRIKSPCALQTYNIDYTAEGSYMTFPDGTMASYVMSLSFKELEPVYADDYDKFAAKHEIGF